MFKRFLAVLNARNKEFVRDRSSMSWNFIFPVLLIAGFSIIFGEDDRALYKVGYVGEKVESAFFETKYTDFVGYDTEDSAVKKLKRYQLDLVVDFSGQQYWVNKDAPNGYITEKLLLQSEPNFKREQTEGRQIRYVDWVLPGILGMNMMFSSLFGVGYVVVRYRKNSVLKRLQATPLSPFEFVSAQMVSRLLIVVATNVIIFTGCNMMFDFFVVGNYLSLLLVSFMGGLSLISMGLVMASRSESEELVGGLLNMTSWPMMMLSGVWFSMEGAPDWVQFIADLLPLTHAVTAAREIMLDGKSIIEVGDHLLILGVMTFVFLSISAFSFKWGSNAR